MTRLQFRLDLLTKLVYNVTDLSELFGQTKFIGNLLGAAREFSYSLKPRAQFIIRADEVAYYHYGKGRVASWMEGRKWSKGYKPPRGRVEWDQMVLSSDMALRLRCKTVTQEVSAD